MYQNVPLAYFCSGPKWKMKFVNIAHLLSPLQLQFQQLLLINLEWQTLGPEATVSSWCESSLSWILLKLNVIHRSLPHLGIGHMEMLMIYKGDIVNVIILWLKTLNFLTGQHWLQHDSICCRFWWLGHFFMEGRKRILTYFHKKSSKTICWIYTSEVPQKQITIIRQVKTEMKIKAWRLHWPETLLYFNRGPIASQWQAHLKMPGGFPPLVRLS